MTFGNRKFTELLGAATVIVFAEFMLVLSDAVIAGRVLGETALGAVSLLMAMFSGVNFFSWLLAAGTSIVFARASGEFQRERASRVAGQGLAASAVLGLFLAAAVALGKNPYFAFLAPDAATRALATSYVGWYPLVALLESVELLLLYLAYANGGERRCLFACVVQVLVNVVFSYGLCDGLWCLPRLGMAGLSLGTVIARAAGLAVILPFAFRRSKGFSFALRPSVRDLCESFQAGFGEACAPLAHALLFLVVTKYVMTAYDSEALPVLAAAFSVIRLTVFFNGIGLALQPLETAYRGEGNSMGARRLLRYASAIAIAESALVSGIVFVAPEIVVSLMGIVDPDLAGGAVRAVRLSVIGLSGYAVTYLMNSHYRSSGRPWRSVAMTIVAFFAVPVALMVPLASHLGLEGVLIAAAVGPLFSLVTLVPLWRPHEDASVGMWSVSLADPQDRETAIGAVEETLKKRCEPAVVRRLTDVLVLAFKRALERNAGAGEGRVHMEVSVLFGAESVVLILRDDGGHFPLEDVGLTVTHMPAVGYNRNIFTLALPKRPAGARAKRERKGRYAVLRGTDVPIEDVRAIIALDRQSFADQYQVSAEDDMALFRLNPENGLVIKDTVTNAVVGYSMILPVNEEVYARIRSGHFIDTDLRPDMLLDFEHPGEYRIYFASIVVHPEHRSASLVVTMMNAMANDFSALAERGIFGKTLTADVVSRDGEKFCQLFGLTEVCRTDHGSKVFEVTALPPKFRVSTDAIARLSGLYWEYSLKSGYAEAPDSE